MQDFLVIRSWKSGRVISRAPRGDYRQKFGAPHITVHRADLLEILSGALKQPSFGLACAASGEPAERARWRALPTAAPSKPTS